MNAYTWSLVILGLVALVSGIALVASAHESPRYVDSTCPGCGEVRRQYSWDKGDALRSHTKHCDAYSEWCEQQEANGYWEQP